MPRRSKRFQRPGKSQHLLCPFHNLMCRRRAALRLSFVVDDGAGEGFLEVVSAFAVLRDVEAFVFLRLADAKSAAQEASDIKQHDRSDRRDAIRQKNGHELAQKLM